MTPEERRQKIELYGNAHALLAEALKEFPREMRQFRPAPGRWTIHEIVVHIADSEANSFARGRKFIAEPGATVMAYDEMRWSQALRYHEQSADDALELFKWLRLTTHRLIRALPEAVWSNTIYHPENGTMTMDDWLDVYARHVPEHIAQMREVYADWKATL
jgi:uncharacterized damage-inducible protein DinB